MCGKIAEGLFLGWTWRIMGTEMSSHDAEIYDIFLGTRIVAAC